MESNYLIKKQIGNRIWLLNHKMRWTEDRYASPWYGTKSEALSELKRQRDLGGRSKARYYIEPTEWEEFHI